MKATTDKLATRQRGVALPDIEQFAVSNKKDSKFAYNLYVPIPIAFVQFTDNVTSFYF